MVIIREKQQKRKEELGIEDILQKKRKENNKLTSQKEVICSSVEERKNPGKNIKEHYFDGQEYGLCIDIGTTTLVLYLWNLSKEEFVVSKAITNPQTRYGADVMMRIMHAQRGLAKQLQQMLFDSVQEVWELIVKEHLHIENIKLKQILVVGNTTMCHLFLGQDVTGLAGSPFQSAYDGNYQCLGKDIGWDFFERIPIKVLSGIASHVGSDAVAVAGVLGVGEEQKIELVIDLGTNAEILLYDKKRIVCCSGAAGPALEGKGIQCGMPGVQGAIAGVKIASHNGNIILETIGGTEPKGICGTGLIDLIYELKRCGIIRPDGYLIDAREAQKKGMPEALVTCLIKKEDENCFLLYKKENGKDIYLEQGGIRQIQLMIGAIYSGVNSILSHTGVQLKDIDRLYVAGAFGNNLSVTHSIQIGLLPDIELEKIKLVGNCAGKGGSLALLSDAFYERMETYAKTIEHIELADNENFKAQFIKGLKFAPHSQNPKS